MTSTPPESELVGRQVALPEIGTAGQARLKAARVLVIGAGGLGSPLLMYLAGAGIGAIGIVEFDHVEASNLHRQILHNASRIDMPKSESAVMTLAGINPHVEFTRHDLPINHDNADDLVSNYDIVADGSDNFATRDAVHAACRRQRRTLVSAAVQLTNGILTTFKSHLGGEHPCFRCLYPDAPGAAATPSCSAIGVLGPAVGVVGSMQAVEVIKEIIGVGSSLSGTLAMYDAWCCDVEHIQLPRRSGCATCGETDLQPPVTGGNSPTLSVGRS